MICRSYGAYRNLGNGNYKDFAPTAQHPDLPNVQTPPGDVKIAVAKPELPG